MIRAMKNSNIFLIGPLGVGKTTTGKQLAKRLHLVFYDSDQEIERQSGVSVATIFEFEGEAGFRVREQKMIAKLTSLDKIVLSTGGGSILSPQNREAFSNNGVVVYLRASLETQLKRTSQRKGVRPLLDIDEPFQKIIELHEIRSPLYESVAELTFDTDLLSPKEIAEKIADELA